MRPWFFLLVVGCAQAPTAPSAAEPRSSEGQAAAVPDAPLPSAQEEVCLTLQRAFQARLDTAAGTCSTDLDCGCYRGVAPGLGCGGITDFKSSVALAGLTTQFVQANCAFPSDCGPSQCLAVCAEGKCAPMPIKL